MPTQVVMPKLSPTMEEGQVTRWLKKEGDRISMGEPLAEIDTDKATMEMQALGSGVLLKILVGEGETAPLGQVIAVLGEPGEDISALAKPAKSTGDVARKTGESKQAVTEDGGERQVEKVDSGQGTQGQPASDEKRGYKSEPAAQARPPQQTPAVTRGGDNRPRNEPAPGNAPPSGERLIVSPIAARMAAEAGINLKGLNGTGPGGRIVKRDVEAAMGRPEGEEHAAPLREGRSAYRDEPASQIRQAIARRLVTSLGPVPHFFLTIEIEMDNAAEMRRAINGLGDERKISINDVIVKVAAAALIKHPQVNASFQDKTIRYYDRADIGIAVAIEDGLITPVIRSADRKSIGQIAAEIRELADRARQRKLAPDEYTGATFSISNLGMFGVDEFTAVINPPEAAILAVGAMAPKPIVRNGDVIVRQLLRVTMSCDHRVIDGATGARFLQTFKKILENPVYLLV